MALKSASEYKLWLDNNQDKQGSPEYIQVFKVYKKSLDVPAPEQPKAEAKSRNPVLNLAKESGLMRGFLDQAAGGAELAQKLIPGGGNYSLPPEAILEGIRAPNYSDIIRRDEAKYQQNRKLQGDEGFDWTRLVGNLASPVSLGSMGVGTPALAATLPAKIGASSGMGAVNAALMPVGSDEGYATSKGTQIGLGGAIPAGLTTLGAGGARALRPLSKTGAYRDVAEYISGLAGNKRQQIIDSLTRNKSQIVPGSKPTAAQSLAGGNIPSRAGDDIIAASNSNPRVVDAVNQMNVSRHGGPLVRLSDDLRTSPTVTDKVNTRFDQQGAAQRQITSSIIRSEAQKAGVDPKIIAQGTDDDILKSMQSNLSSKAAIAYGNVRNDMVDPRSYQDMLTDRISGAKTRLGKAADSKAEALKDWGRFKTLESQQRNRGLNRMMPEGEPKVPYRYTPHAPVSKEAGLAANEAKDIASKRLLEENSRMSELQTLLTNTVGASKKSVYKLMEKPSVKKAIKEAEKWSKEEGVYFPSKQGDKFSVGNLQSIKKQIAKLIKNKTLTTAKNPITEDQARILSGTLDEFNSFIKSRSRGYEKAEEMFAKESMPINRVKIAKELEKLRANAMNRETPSAFTREMATDAAKSLKRGTGFSRYKGLEDVFTKDQVVKLDKLQTELIRNGQYEKMVKDVNAILPDLLEGIEPQLVNALYRPIMAINAGLRKISKNVAPKYEKAAQKIMENPDELIEVISGNYPEAERSLIVELMTKGTPIVVGQQSGINQTTGEQ